MALYSRGKYEESIKALLAAADLNPSDARCYLFLSKAYLSSPSQADEVIRRFERYASSSRSNALAQYYYAVSLWKGKRSEATSIDYPLVERLLKKAIALDGTLAEAHLQLGILYADQREYAKSLPEYTRAIALDPSLADAHYRLGQYYVHAGRRSTRSRSSRPSSNCRRITRRKWTRSAQRFGSLCIRRHHLDTGCGDSRLRTSRCGEALMLPRDEAAVCMARLRDCARGSHLLSAAVLLLVVMAALGDSAAARR